MSTHRRFAILSYNPIAAIVGSATDAGVTDGGYDYTETNTDE
jgi:hypothetical protein